MWQVASLHVAGSKLGVMMVNHKRVLHLLFLFVGLLGACAEGEEVAGNTAVPTPPPTIELAVMETAVPTYLDLIQRYPTSPWSWLAWARLEPVATEPN